MPATVSVARFSDLEAQALAAGLTDQAAWAYAVLAWWGEHYGIRAPRIISGWRSPERQRELQREWDAGRRAGLAVRPADASVHTIGEAWDVESGDGLALMAYFAPYLGVRWGGNFSTPDPNHFDLGAL